MAGEVGLTDAKIAGLKAPPTGRVEYPDKLIAGLRVRVGSTGAKTFILRKRVGTTVKNITLGTYGARFNLAAARKKARDLLVDIEAGKDPTATLATPRRNGGAGTVRAMIETYLASEVRGKKRSAREIERILTGYVTPVIGDRLADAITRADVSRLVDGVMNANPDRPARAMARGVHAQLSAFYSWAMPRLDRLPANPCRDAGRPAPMKARDRVLTEAEIKAFWTACEAAGWPFGPGFKLLLLTGQRRGEVFEADLAEFDLEGRLWTVPGERAKNGVTHLVPLSPAAVTVIKALPEIKGTPKLLPSRADPERGASGFSRALEIVQRHMGKTLEVEAVTPFRLHDLRRTVATGMQRLGVTQPVVEAVLNHVSGSQAGIVGVYQRHDFAGEKRHALEAWAAEVARIVAGEEKSNVRPFRRKR